MPTITRSPTIVTTTPNTGTLSVTNASNVTAADGAFATVTGVGSAFVYSHAIVTSGYDFSAIPAFSTINSITYRAKRKVSDAATATVVSLPVWRPSGNSFVQLSPWTASLVYESSTVSSSLPSLAVLQGSSFKFEIQVSFQDGDAIVASIDHIELIIDYTENQDTPPTSDPPTLGQVRSSDRLINTARGSHRLG